MLADVRSELQKKGTDLHAIEQQLMAIPGYQQAVQSGNTYTRGEMARRFASQHGIDIPSGVSVDGSGRLTDANAGTALDSIIKYAPLAIGAAAGGAALAGAGAGGGAAAASGAGAADAGGTLGATTIGSGFLPAIAGDAGISSAGIGAGTGGALASTALGSGYASPIAGGTGISSSGAGAGAPSMMDKIFSKAKGMSSVLGGAAKDAAANKTQQNNSQLNWDRVNLDSQRQHANAALADTMLKDYTPKTAHWGGPGSGLRGETVSYSGGSRDALAKMASDPVLAQLLEDYRTKPDIAPLNNTSNKWDKLLGGAALGTSILGAL